MIFYWPFFTDDDRVSGEKMVFIDFDLKSTEVVLRLGVVAPVCDAILLARFVKNRVRIS